MELLIDGKRAALKKDSSFDFVSENRAFSDADDYTLSITLPLAGCAANLQIFGHIDRLDCVSRHRVLKASIVDNRFSKNGVVTIVEANENEVKCQFLADRSVQNFLTTFDDIYLNELPLGAPSSLVLPQIISWGNINKGNDSVALPWWNEAASVMNNEVVSDAEEYKWSETTLGIGKLSFMPYLIFIAKKICQALGYTYDFQAWENSPEKYLLVCNVLPASWDIPQFARALPHWSVMEFFSELEKILTCEIDIDHHSKHIGLTFSKDVEGNTKVVKIDNIIDSFSSEVSYEDEICQFKGSANLRYADRGDESWNLDQCQWLVELMRQENKYFMEFDTEVDFNEWIATNFGALGTISVDKDSDRGPKIGSLIHIIETDRYVMGRIIHNGKVGNEELYTLQWLDINRFGDDIKDLDSDNDIEVRFVPANIQTTDDKHGFCVFLSPSNYAESECLDGDGIRQPAAYSNYLKGEGASAPEYYDKIYLAYWDGSSANDSFISYSDNLLPPCPKADARFTLKNRYEDYLSGLRINPREKFKITWLSTELPDVRSIFHIRGKRYLCEKITATFTENGMSQLLKGEFYPLVGED